MKNEREEELVLQLQYGLPLYAYLIHRTGTFIFPYHNLATPLFLTSMPLFYIHLQTSLFPLMTHFYSDIYVPSLYLHTTRLYPLIHTTLVLSSISTHLYLAVEP